MYIVVLHLGGWGSCAPARLCATDWRITSACILAPFFRSLLWTLLSSKGHPLLGGEPIAKRVIICCPTSLVG